MDTFKINNVNYNISIFDTTENILEYVALQNNTLPDYIKIVKLDFDTYTGEFLFLKDILNNLDLKKIIGMSFDKEEEGFRQVLNEIQKDFPKVTKNDIVLELLRVKYNNELDLFKAPKDGSLIVLSIKLPQLEGVDFWNTYAINNRLNDYIKTFSRKLENLKRKVDKSRSIVQKYNKYKPLETTEFIQDSLVYKYMYTSFVDPLDLFNTIQLNNEFPFCKLRYNGQVYYKVYKTFVPKQSDIDIIDNNKMVIYYNIGKETYNEMTFNFIKEQPDEKFTIELLLEISGETDIIVKDKLMNLFESNDFTFVSSKSEGIRGIFAIPELQLARDVFLDFLMNDTIISYYFYNDESRNMSMRSSSFYIYFGTSDSDSDNTTAYLSQKVVSRSDVYYQTKNLPLFTPYLNVRISKASNINQVKRFMRVFSIVMDIYQDSYASIVSRYSKFIPNFKQKNDVPFISKTTQDKAIRVLQDKNPDLFVYGYPTKCERKKQPVPINKNEVINTNEKSVINFPKNSEDYYYCPTKEYPYPGLLTNKLINKEDYPFLPCCYPKNQMVKNKLYYNYVKDISTGEQKKINNPINLVKFKALDINRKGLLPKNIYYMLNTIEPNFTYYRIGTPFDTNSFIHAILLAMDPDYLLQKDKTNYAMDVRRNLANVIQSSVIQELYNWTSDKITNTILDETVEFDSKYFIGVLKSFFKCNIVVLERNEQYPNSNFEIPHFTQGYLFKQFNPQQPLVIVYKHYGIRSDHLQTPHYELIGYESQPNSIMYSFIQDYIKNNIFSYFNQTYQLYLFGKGIYKHEFIQGTFSINYQSVDKFGKTRKLHVDTTVVYTPPTSPLFNIEIKDIPDKINTQKNILKFINKHKWVIKQQDVIDDVLVGYLLTNGYYIPIQHTSNIDTSIPIGRYIGYNYPLQEKNSLLSISKQNKKLADYLMQYTLYSFSLYYHLQNVSLPDLDYTNTHSYILNHKLQQDVIDDYINNQMIIEENHDYDLNNVKRTLSLNTSFFNNNKLVVSNKNVKRKLANYLRFMIQKNKQYVLNYNTHIYLDNFYTYVNDFTQYPEQYIYISENALLNWLNTLTQGIVNVISNVFIKEREEPYFYSNWAIDNNKPILIQNVKYGELLRALAVVYNYNKYNLNTGYYSKPLPEEVHYRVIYARDNELVQETVGDHPVGTVIRYNQYEYAAVIYSS